MKEGHRMIDHKDYSLGSKQRLDINLTHIAEWMPLPETQMLLAFVSIF